MNVLVTVALLLVVVVLVMLRQLSHRIVNIGQQIANIGKEFRDANSVHDTTHPVFSVQQLRRARQRFETEHGNQFRLETQLYESNEWRARHREKKELSREFRQSLRTVCESIVQSECAWKEYEFMIGGNANVANGRESRSAILQQFTAVLRHTRGTPNVMTVAPNSAKVRRVNEILENWEARLAGVDVESLRLELPDIGEETFDFGDVETRRRSALLG